MAAKAKKTEAAQHPLQADLEVLDRLIQAGLLITKPQNGSAKPRKVMAAGLAHDHHIVLWLSKNTVEIH